MAVTGSNAMVEYVLQNNNYGWVHEVVGDLRVDENGHWRMNGVPIDDTVSAIAKQANGTVALRLIIVPIVSNFVAVDNTLVQAKMPIETE